MSSYRKIKWKGIRGSTGGLFAPRSYREFFVDATNGNDADPGTSRAQAWQTIGKVNGETFRPTDHILFKRGETWNTGPLGRNLIPPSSGIAGSLIIFDAYGSGAAPIIDAGTSGSPGLTFSVDYVIARNLHLASNPGEADAVQFIGGNYCILEDCEVDDGGWAGVYVTDRGGVTTTNNIIRNNDIHDALHEGVYIKNETATNGVSNTLVEGNTIYDCGGEPVQNGFAAPAGTFPSGTIMRRNILTGHGDIGATDIGGDILFELNELTGAGTGINGVLWFRDGDGAIIRNNIIHNTALNFAFSAGGIHLDDGDNTQVYHNTIYGISNSGAGDGYGIFVNNVNNGVDIRNNSISGCDNQMGWNNAPDTVDRNCVFGVTDQTGTNAVVANPLLVNPGAGNLHLLVGSPCRGEGAVGTGVTEDYDGVTRGDPPDIGALEYVA